MFVFRSRNFNLWDTYASKQTLRWRVFDNKRTLSFIIESGSHCIMARQKNNRIILSCNEDEFFNYWFDYFTTSIDYDEYLRVARHTLYPVCAVAHHTTGVHLIKLELWECILENVMWYRCSSKVARRRLRELNEVCGIIHTKTFRDFGRVTWYEVPDAKTILDNANELWDNLDFNVLEKALSAATWYEQCGESLELKSETCDVKNDYKDIMLELKASGLFTMQQADRVARNAFMLNNAQCIPRKLSNKIVRDDIDWYCESDMMKQGYIGALLSTQSMTEGARLWG